jgi:hypothetical protein
MEADLHSGALTALAATNALELGIDVGSLDLTLHLGFPGSVSSLWQQSGRAGRREQHSLSLLVGFDGPLDQHFMRHPGELFGRPIECALVREGLIRVWVRAARCPAAQPVHSQPATYLCISQFMLMPGAGPPSLGAHEKVLLSVLSLTPYSWTQATPSSCASTWPVPRRSWC